MQDIYIGVDGGASKCKVVVEHADGTQIGHAVGGPANIRMSVQESWQNIINTINNALKETDIELTDSENYKFHIGMGLAGTELDSAVDEFMTQPHPFATIKLESDAYTACVGAHDGADGGMIIIGTGAVGLRIKEDELVQVGGWGFPYGDEGSGAWYGLEATRLAFQAYDGRVPYSPMLDAVLARFHDEIVRLLNWANTAQSTQYAQLAPIVFEYLEQKDPWAEHLAKIGAKEIDNIFYGIENQSKNGVKVPYSLFGGITKLIQPWLCQELQDRIVPVKHDATKGAIIMLKQKMKV